MIVFSLLYMPCISTIAVLKKEIGLKYTILTCLLQFVVAYLICFIIYQIAVGSILAKILISLLVIVAIVFLFVLSKKITNKKGICGFDCKNCKKHC